MSFIDFSTSRSTGLLLLTLIFLMSLSTATLAQKVDKEKLATGTLRAKNAAKVVSNLVALPADSSIPSSLLEKARAIGVFPSVTKVNALFIKGMKGYGLVSRRIDGGWSTPAYYGFGVTDKGWTKIKSESPGLVMLFMDDATLKGFEKDHIAIAGAVAGPVGDIDDKTYKSVSGVSIFIYAVGDTEIEGISIADDSSATSSLGTDNNINKAVFGMKGLDVFWNKLPLPATLPTEIVEFQKALTVLSRP